MRTLRVVYYTHPAFWEQALSLVRALSPLVELHLVVELAPTTWQSAAFDFEPRPLRPGLVSVADVLGDGLPAHVAAHWQEAASFHFAVHGSVRSLHPSSWRRGREVRQFVKEIGADILHVDDVDVSPRLPLALARDWKLPVLLNVHDPSPHEGEHGWRKTLSRRLAYRRATRFVLYNHHQADAFRRRYALPADAVDVVPLGVGDLLTAWKDPVATEQPNHVLFFGRLSPYKGLDALYAAAPRVADAVPDVRFVVAGMPVPGYAPPRPPSLPEPASISVLSGYLDNPTLARLLQRTSVVVCPYVDATQSGVALTAYSLGKPVIASDVGGLAEYVVHGQTGLLVPPGDPGALAAALAQVLIDPALRQRLQEGARSAAARFSWEAAAGRFAEIYRALLP